MKVQGITPEYINEAAETLLQPQFEDPLDESAGVTPEYVREFHDWVATKRGGAIG